MEFNYFKMAGVKADRTSLAGSSLTLNRAVSVLMDYGEVALNEALWTVTANPARLLNSKQLCAKIEKGQRANLIVFEQGKEQLNVSAVLLRGEQVYP